MRFRLIASFVVALACTARVLAAPTVEDFAANADFDISLATLSPTGEYLALTVPLGDRSALLTLRMKDFTRVGAMQLGRNIHITDLDWIGSDRLIYAIGQKYGDLKRPLATGELFAIDVDGDHPDILVGYRAGGTNNPSATRIQQRTSERIFATLIEPVDDDPTQVFIASFKFDNAEEPYTRVDRLDVRNGRRTKVAQAPVPRADFLLDHAQQVRFAWGAQADNANKLHYRADDDSEWVLLNDEGTSSRVMTPLGFSSDNTTAYLLVDHPSGPSSVQAMDPGTRVMREVVRDTVADPFLVLRSPRDESPFGVIVAAETMKALYFDPESADAKLHRMLQNSFPGQIVQLRRLADDGETGLLTVHGSRNSGEIYAFNAKTRAANFLAAADSRLDPDLLGQTKGIRFDARDGTPIHGYLTLPPGSDGKNLPLVVMPHGGPFGIADNGLFDTEVQLLATRGYAVLQPNFRGSGGYGRAFQLAGYRQWGRLMQDDVTDATRWAIAQGIADERRICIHGSSYGAYAALMGVAREPSLYRCASGNIGVYDLRAMHRVGDTSSVKWGQNFLADVMAMDRLDQDSPTLLADRIRVPVLLSAGKEDERAPPLHTERMRDALQKAGVPVETKIYAGEGHGYFVIANRVDYYTRLLGFLDRHIGQAASASAPAPNTPPNGS